MKLRTIALMATILTGAEPQSTNADAGFVHVIPSLTLAQPCTAESGCAYTWTLASRMGEALNFAEERYGRRDPAWTPLGVEFADQAAPQVWYPDFGRGYRTIVIQLTPEAASDEKRALFQLAHEVVHLLSPVGPDGSASVLEEGLATYNSLDYLRDSEFEVGPEYIAAEAYEAAYWMLVELEQAQPDFAEGIQQLRARHGSLSGLSTGDLTEVFPAISTALAARLAAHF